MTDKLDFDLMELYGNINNIEDKFQRDNFRASFIISKLKHLCKVVIELRDDRSVLFDNINQLFEAFGNLKKEIDELKSPVMTASEVKMREKIALLEENMANLRKDLTILFNNSSIKEEFKWNIEPCDEDPLSCKEPPKKYLKGWEAYKAVLEGKMVRKITNKKLVLDSGDLYEYTAELFSDGDWEIVE